MRRPGWVPKLPTACQLPAKEATALIIRLSIPTRLLCSSAAQSHTACLFLSPRAVAAQC